MKVLISLLILVFSTTMFADDFVSIETPAGPMQVHRNVAERLSHTQAKFATFESMAVDLKRSAPKQKLLFVDVTGATGEAKILGTELRNALPTMVITESTFAVDLVRQAEKIAERERPVSVFQVLTWEDMQWSNFQPRNDVTYVVTKPAEFLKPNPYSYYGENDNFGSRRVDRFGRDLLAGFFYDVVKSDSVSEVSIFDYGAQHLDLAAEILIRIKYEGLRGPSAGFVFHWMDLALAKSAGGWGPNILHLLGNRERLSRFMTETPDALQGTEFVDFDFRLYVDTRERIEETSDWKTGRSWRAGEIPVRALTRNAQNMYPQEFQIAKEKILRLFWANVLSQEAEEAAIARRDPRLETQIPVVIPNFEMAAALSWEIIERELITAEAFALIRLEKLLFREDSGALAIARTNNVEVSAQQLSSDDVFAQRVKEVGQAAAIKELSYFNRLNDKFFTLINENAPRYRYTLYKLRRSVFGRGQDLGGRLQALLSGCADYQFSQEKLNNKPQTPSF